MTRQRISKLSPSLIMGIGAVLFLFAVGHHAREFVLLTNVVGPAIAFLLDGLLALGVIYGGYWLFRTESSPENRRRIVGWSIGGSLVFLVVFGATFLVRTIEGRSLTEPAFPLLISVEVGMIAGLLVGYYSTQAREDAREARTVRDALAFVNDIIRHDLRNDLNVIEGYAELIEGEERGENGEPAGVEPAIIAEKANEALSRIESTDAITDTLVGEPQLEPTDLVSITAELAGRTEATYDVTVATDFPNQALVPANAGLRSVVDNLLENAVEHNDAEDARIEVAVETDGDTVRMFLSDNGPGIPKDQKEMLFEADETEKHGGGGLTLVQTLVEGYDGSIRLEDNESRGSTFVVELPRID
ncbi:ATP-binding protein [Halorussus halobius]|uniref:ATP-binding protein n=1 Tax=Halorussus halobius TaxID=1710537 RepID=UPI001B2FFCC3|nr:ATP-binding protein [Halorussus halobius]